MKNQMFSMSYPGSGSSANENKTNQDSRQADQCCCAPRQRALSFDVFGNEVGCITGYRNKKSIQIVALRGNGSSPVLARRSLNICPIHGGQSENKKNLTMEDDTKFTYKDVIIIWNDSVEKAKNGQWEDAFNLLLEIKNYSAIMRFNLGQMAWAFNRPDLAKEHFLAAVEKDPHMALAHFQLGMVNYHLHRYNESRGSYDKAKTNLRGNKLIDYRQLGLMHKLYECEILYNLALTYATMMNSSEFALELLEEASKVVIESRHDPMIEKAQKKLMRNELYEPYVLPGNLLFRPPKSKVDNLKNIDYLGKAKIVSELPEANNNNNKDDFKVPVKGYGKNTFRPIDDDFSSDDDGFSPTSGQSSSPTPSMIAKMTHRDTLATWHEGVTTFDKGNLREALDLLNGIIDPSAKILYNIGILQKSQGQLEDALYTFKGVVSSDPYLAIGHFQLGIVQGQLRDCEAAWESFGKAHEGLRGNKMIDYKQLGLQYKLHKCEVLHNEAWTYNEQNQRDWAQKLLDEALGCKADARHDKMDESRRNFSNGYSFQLYEPPKPLLFRPPKSKIDNLERKDYLGKAKIVAKLPSQRQGSSTPPPSSNSLGVSILPPRSKTPTPASSGQKAPPPFKPPPVGRSVSASSPALSARQVALPTVTVDDVGSSSPVLPRRPPPSKSPTLSHDMPDGKHSPPPNRHLPSPSRLSPVPSRPVPQKPGSPGALSDGHHSPPPSRPLPSPNRTSPVPARPVPQCPVPNSPNRPLPSPNRTSPVQERPLPQRPTDSADAPPTRALPSPKRSSPLPDRPVPSPPRKTSSPELPDRPLPLPPKSTSSELHNRPLPVCPTSDSCDLSSRPVPPRPLSGVSDVQDRSLPPPPPGNAESEVSPRSFPSATKFGRRDNVIDSPPDLPSKPPPVKSKISSSSLPKDHTPSDLPSRPVPPVPRNSTVEASAESAPELPARPVSIVSRTSSSSLTSLDDLPFRPVPSPPASVGSSEPELPPRPVSGAPRLPAKLSPGLQDRPVPPPPASSGGRRPSSPGLPDLPPPPPPKKEPSPRFQRKQNVDQAVSGDKKAPGHKAKLVKIETDSPPVLRKAAAVTVQKEKSPSIPSRPGNGANDDKPIPPTNKPLPAWQKPSPNGGKPLPATSKPPAATNKPPSTTNKPSPPAPIHAFKPQAKANGGQSQGKKRTALVIASHEASGEGEVSVSEGDLITITGEDGDWLQVEVKGEKGRLLKTCVKNFSKPGSIQLNF